MSFLDTLREHRLVAILRGHDPERVERAAEVLVEAGIGIIEVTFTVPGAGDVVRALVDRGVPAQVGLGTVTTPAQVRQAQTSGARFLVSPGSPPSLLDAMRETGLPCLPGVLTPTEVMAARASRVDVVKLFPASAVGPSYLGHLRGPFPDLEVVPSGGIGTDAAPVWIAAGAAAVGIGSLATPADLDRADWVGISRKARAGLAAVARHVEH